MRTTEEDFEKANAGPAVLVDFDDTAAEQNVAELLLKRFGDPTWQDVRRQFRDAQLTLNEYQEITFRNIRADRDSMQSYVKQNANLRPYFKELWCYCFSNNIPMAIVSQGLDFYIEALLEQEGVAQIPVHAVNTRFTPGGLTYQYHYARPGQERLGNSKGLIVDGYRQQGHYIFYAGDGISDFEGATRADMLFAHRRLAEECSLQGIPFEPFSDFQGMLQAVQKFDLDGLRSEPRPSINSFNSLGGTQCGGEAEP